MLTIIYRDVDTDIKREEKFSSAQEVDEWLMENINHVNLLEIEGSVK